MAIVRLEFDLDSDVYPELYQTLSALRTARARAERMRQLAAAGLVWENVRIYGAAAIGPTPAASPTGNKPTAAPPRRTAVAVTEDEPPAVAVAAAAPASPPRGLKGLRKLSASAIEDNHSPTHPARSEDDFVDLAINAQPVPATAPASALAEDGDDTDTDDNDDETESLQEVVNELPVLMDIVNETADEPDPPVMVPLAPLKAKRGAAPSPPPSEPAQPEEALVSSDEAIHLTSLAQKPAMRSRLMRMKEKGLFKNG
jgi:hypothetical protein